MPDCASWTSLISDDVWARIFSIVAEDVYDDLEMAFLRDEVCADEVRNHCQYQHLRSVCKVFRAVFHSHPELSAVLYLEEDPPPTGVLSLLEYLRCDKLTVTTLLAERESSLVAALSGAVAAANRPLQKLTSAVIQNCSTLSVTLLSTCTALTSCSFTHNQGMLDIKPLQALPRLSELRLQGKSKDSGFVGIGRLLHLTKLDIKNTAVEGQQDQNQWMFASSLQTLDIERSSLRYMHEDGLSQCTGLTSLCLDDCIIECQGSENTLDIRQPPIRLPDNLTALRQLIQLQLTVSSSIDGVFEYPWLAKLTALEQLHLDFECETTQFNVTDQLLSLTNLKHLAIIQGLLAYSPQNIVSLEASLHLLPMLQTVRLYAGFLKLDHRVLNLVELKSLKRLDFCRCQLLAGDTARYFGALMRSMGAKRPDVTCYLGAQI